MAKKKDKKSKSVKKLEKLYKNSGGLQINQQRNSVFSGISQMLPKGRTEQFILGAVIGVAAAYVLTDEQARAKIMRAGMKLYAGLAGDLAEMKEQLSDIQAELQAEQGGAL